MQILEEILMIVTHELAMFVLLVTLPSPGDAIVKALLLRLQPMLSL